MNRLIIDIGSSGYIITMIQQDKEPQSYHLTSFNEPQSVKAPNIAYVEAFGNIRSTRIHPTSIYFTKPQILNNNKQISSLAYFMNWKNYFYNADATINYDRNEPTMPSRNFQSLRISIQSLYEAFFYKMFEQLNLSLSEEKSFDVILLVPFAFSDKHETFMNECYKHAQLLFCEEQRRSSFTNYLQCSKLSYLKESWCAHSLSSQQQKFNSFKENQALFTIDVGGYSTDYCLQVKGSNPVFGGLNLAGNNIDLLVSELIKADLYDFQFLQSDMFFQKFKEFKERNDGLQIPLDDKIICSFDCFRYSIAILAESLILLKQKLQETKKQKNDKFLSFAEKYIEKITICLSGFESNMLDDSLRLQLMELNDQSILLDSDMLSRISFYESKICVVPDGYTNVVSFLITRLFSPCHNEIIKIYKNKIRKQQERSSFLEFKNAITSKKIDDLISKFPLLAKLQRENPSEFDRIRNNAYLIADPSEIQISDLLTTEWQHWQENKIKFYNIEKFQIQNIIQYLQNNQLLGIQARLRENFISIIDYFSYQHSLMNSVININIYVFMKVKEVLTKQIIDSSISFIQNHLKEKNQLSCIVITGIFGQKVMKDCFSEYFVDNTKLKIVELNKQITQISCDIQDQVNKGDYDYQIYVVTCTSEGDQKGLSKQLAFRYEQIKLDEKIWQNRICIDEGTSGSLLFFGFANNQYQQIINSSQRLPPKEKSARGIGSLEQPIKTPSFCQVIQLEILKQMVCYPEYDFTSNELILDNFSFYVNKFLQYNVLDLDILPKIYNFGDQLEQQITGQMDPVQQNIRQSGQSEIQQILLSKQVDITNKQQFPDLAAKIPAMRLAKMKSYFTDDKIKTQFFKDMTGLDLYKVIFGRDFEQQQENLSTQLQNEQTQLFLSNNQAVNSQGKVVSLMNQNNLIVAEWKRALYSSSATVEFPYHPILNQQTQFIFDCGPNQPRKIDVQIEFPLSHIYVSHLYYFYQMYMNSLNQQQHFCNMTAITLTVPCSAKMQHLYYLRQCARLALLPDDINFVFEPNSAFQAIIQKIQRQNASYKLDQTDAFLIIDGGGGTTDISLIQYINDNNFKVLNTKCFDIAGSEVDKIIKEQVRLSDIFPLLSKEQESQIQLELGIVKKKIQDLMKDNNPFEITIPQNIASSLIENLSGVSIEVALKAHVLSVNPSHALYQYVNEVYVSTGQQLKIVIGFTFISQEMLSFFADKKGDFFEMILNPQLDIKNYVTETYAQGYFSKLSDRVKQQSTPNYNYSFKVTGDENLINQQLANLFQMFNLNYQLITDRQVTKLTQKHFNAIKDQDKYFTLIQNYSTIQIDAGQKGFDIKFIPKPGYIANVLSRVANRLMVDIDDYISSIDLPTQFVNILCVGGFGGSSIFTESVSKFVQQIPKYKMFSLPNITADDTVSSIALGGLLLPEEKDYVNDNVKCYVDIDLEEYMKSHMRSDLDLQAKEQLKLQYEKIKAQNQLFFKECKFTISCSLQRMFNFKTSQISTVIFKNGYYQNQVILAKPTFNGIELCFTKDMESFEYVINHSQLEAICQQTFATQVEKFTSNQIYYFELGQSNKFINPPQQNASILDIRGIPIFVYEVLFVLRDSSYVEIDGQSVNKQQVPRVEIKARIKNSDNWYECGSINLI